MFGFLPPSCLAQASDFERLGQDQMPGGNARAKRAQSFHKKLRGPLYRAAFICMVTYRLVSELDYTFGD